MGDINYNDFAVNRYLADMRRIAYASDKLSVFFIKEYVGVGLYLKEVAPDYLSKCMIAQCKLLGFDENETLDITELFKRYRLLPRKIIDKAKSKDIIEKSKGFNEWYKEGYDYAFETKGKGQINENMHKTFIGGFLAGQEIYNHQNKQ